MKFPNAAKGVKKIFNAEIISLIAALIGGAGLVLGLIGASKETGESAGTITLTVSGVLLIVSGIAILVAGVINIIGFIQAAKDEEGIKRAVLCTLFSALFAFVAAFFENQTGFLGGLGSVLSTIATVLNMLVALFMIGGLMNLSAKCNRPDMVTRGHSILSTIVVSYIITLALSLLIRFGAYTSSFGAGVINWLSGLSALFTVFIYVLELIYLANVYHGGIKMKKLLSSVSVILVLVMLLSMAAPMTASAAGDEITVKDLTAHIYNMEDTETLQCLFKSSMPDMAFISTVDFLKRAYVDEPSEVKNADGTYTITNPKGTMVIDPEHDTLHFDSFEDFVSAKENVDGTEMDVPYLKEHAPVKEGEINGLDLDLSPYKIDIIEYDGKTYFPATTLGLLFSATYNTAVYSEDNIYFIHCADIAMGNCYFKSNTAYETLKRSKDLVELTYNELCFAVDKLYGRPGRAEIASMLEEKSLDEALDEYNDDTRRAKELLLSENMADYVLGTAYLGQVFADGGHTAINYPAISAIITTGTALNAELNRLINEEDFHDPNAIKYAMSSITSGQRAIDMSKFRSEKYKAYELVKSWDDKSSSKLYVTGDTAVFAFDSFVNEAVYHFKWSLDYAEEKGIKRFVIDLSCNSGGNAAVVMYIMAMITNKNRDSYVASYRKIQTLTSNITRIDNDMDLNLDGEINDLDKSVYYDFEYAFITSGISYSCGNLLPCLAKDAGFPILGERSGGGACSLLIAYTPEDFFYTLSSYNKFITKDNKDVDNGAELDFDLTKRVTDDAGNKTIDYSGLYDLEDISRKIDALYNGPVFGDVDGDGDVTIDDATLIQKAAIDLIGFTNLQKQFTTGCGKTGEVKS